MVEVVAIHPERLEIPGHQHRRRAMSFVQEGQLPKKIAFPIGLQQDAPAGVVLEEHFDFARAYDEHRIARISVIENDLACSVANDVELAGQKFAFLVVEKLKKRHLGEELG